MLQVISPSLSPNTEWDDVFIAFKMLFCPWTWKTGSSTVLVEDWFTSVFKTDAVYLFSSGRASMYALLKMFGIEKGDEVIVQAFTCVAVPEVVLWAGGTPVYADIDSTYNINPRDIERKITKNTKAIVIQHTFGIPAQIKKIKRIADKQNLILIEDCAHALGATVDGKLAGTFADASFFSFGRDKIISSVFGGAVILNDSSKKIDKKKLEEFHDTLSYPSFYWIKQQLLHPILFNTLILPLYHVFGIGKLFLVLFQKLHLLSFPVESSENKGKMPKKLIKKFPNALAVLAINQLSKLERYNKKRIDIAKKYMKQPLLNGPTFTDGAVYLRYPVKSSNRDEILYQSKQNGILLGNWYHHVIDPSTVQVSSVLYQKGMCPKAEYAAQTVINLPTYPRMKYEDVERVSKTIQQQV